MHSPPHLFLDAVVEADPSGDVTAAVTANDSEVPLATPASHDHNDVPNPKRRSSAVLCMMGDLQMQLVGPPHTAAAVAHKPRASIAYSLATPYSPSTAT